MARIDVEVYERTDPRLGRNREHDERSRAYALLPKEAKPKGVTRHWTSHAPVLNQGSTSSCTGNALAQWLNTDYATGIRKRPFLTESDALHIYSLATRLDYFPGTYPPDDQGSSGNAACKAGRQLGYLTGYGWLFSFTSMQAALEQMPLMVGTVWTQSMFTPTNGLIKVGKINDSTIAGGHEYLLSGVDWQASVVELRNSWGGQTEWEGCKAGGYAAIEFGDMARLLATGGDVTIPKLVV